MNALPAYEAGIFGSGVLIGVIDTGIDTGNVEFAGRIDSRSADLVIPSIVGNSNARSGGPSLLDTDGHGNAVAAIVGAAKNDIGVHGVAPLANLLVFRADSEDQTEIIIFGQALEEGIDRSIAAGVDVLNLSLGSNEAGSRGDFRRLFAKTASADIVTVIAAGNQELADPEQSAQAALDATSLGSVIIAGALTRNGAISSFSNRAGVAAEVFLTAPGELLSVPQIGGDGTANERFSGTSAAVPIIAGAAALLRGQWPNLTAQQTVDILLDTATDAGAPGTDEIYGRGILNIGAALQPSGAVTTSSITGSSVELAPTSFEISPGLAITGEGLGDYVFLDQYNRDFTAPVNSLFNARSATTAISPMSTLRPFEIRAVGATRVGNGVARFQYSQRDDGHLDVEKMLRAPTFQTGIGTPWIEERVDVSFTQAVEGAVLTFANGFSPREIDRNASASLVHGLASRDGWVDPFLAAGRSSIGSAASFDLGKQVRVNAIFSVAENVEQNFASIEFQDGLAPEPATIVNSRLGLHHQTERGDLIAIEIGHRAEEGSLFGTTFGGALGAVADSQSVYQTAMVDIGLARKWRLSARGSVGGTSVNLLGSAQFANSVDRLVTSHFSAAVYRDAAFFDGDRLTLSVSQPLKVEAGAINLAVPVSYDYERQAFDFANRSVSLAGGAREIDIEAQYRIANGPFGYVEMSALYQVNATYQQTQTNAFLGTVRIGTRF